MVVNNSIGCGCIAIIQGLIEKLGKSCAERFIAMTPGMRALMSEVKYVTMFD